MKYLKQLIALVVLLASVNTIKAYDFEYEGIAYNILSTTEMTCEVDYYKAKCAGEIKIPETVEYMGRKLMVTQLGERCFYGRKQLTGIDLSDTKVGAIKESSFQDCPALTSVKLPVSLKGIWDSCFDGCTALKELDISHTSVVGLGSSTFRNCKSLASVKLPASLRQIESECFNGCTALKELDISHTNVEALDSYAFYKCKSLTSVKLPSTLRQIGSECFSGCESLEAIKIPYVNTIGDCCFCGCTSLTSIIVPVDCTYIGKECFAKCTSLTSLTLPNITCGDGFISGCTALETLTYGGDINEKTLSGASSLTSLTLERSCANIFPKYAFDGIPLLKLIIKDGPEPLHILDNDGVLQLNTLEYLYVGRKLYDEHSSHPLICIPKIKHITFGEELDRVKVDYYQSNRRETGFESLKSLKSIQCNDPVPPTISGTISKKQYTTLIVYVPDEAVEDYKHDAYWKPFWNIQGMSHTGIDNVPDDASEKIEIGRFDTLGRPVTENYNGIIIIRYSDGSTEKRYTVQ